MTAVTKANSNFHPMTESSVFDQRLEEQRFREYRRQWIENPAKFHVAEFPLDLDIESTGVCNLRCPFCATTTENWGPKAPGYMRWEVYTRIIDEGSDNGLMAIKLSFRGEPMLHQKLHEMVAYAKKKGVLDVYFNTNATLLDEKRFNQMIDAGLDRISVSFEGTTKDVYEKNRVGAKFEKIVKNIQALKTIREKRGVKHPQIRIQTVLLPELKPHFDEYVKMWKPYVDEVAYLDPRRESPSDDHRDLKGDWACPFLWQRMTILWDGTLLPCLMHGISDFSLLAYGNVMNRKIKDAWKSTSASRYRELHMAGKAHEIEACNRCSFRGMELEKRGIAKNSLPVA